MKNLLLSNLARADALFPVAAIMPELVRNILVDTYVPVATKRIVNRGFMDRLTIFLTDQCNLRCEHCFIVKGQAKEWEMGLNEYRKLFESLAGQVSQLLLTGGEPTLRNDFGELLVLAGKVGRVSTINTFTNGLKPHRLIEAFEHALSETELKLNVQTSIDGLPDFHDRHRRVDGAFAKAVETIESVERLRSSHKKRIGRIVATTAVSKRNIHDLTQIIDTILETPAVPGFTFVRGASDGVFELEDRDNLSTFEPDDYSHYLTPDEMFEALKTIDDHLWQHHRGNLFYAYNRTNLETVATSLKEKTGQVDCKMGLVDLIILQNGDVARCEMLKSFANLSEFDWSLERLLKSAAYTDFMDETSGCWCTHDCGVGVSLMYEKELIRKLFV